MKRLNLVVCCCLILIPASFSGAGTEIKLGGVTESAGLLHPWEEGLYRNSVKATYMRNGIQGFDPEAHWPFDEGGGDTAEDAANGNHGTLHGPLWIEGIEGYALSFDGEGDYVEVAHHESLNLTGDLTITVWYRRDGILDDRYASILRKTGGVYQLFASDPGNRTFFGDAYGWVRTRERIVLPDRWIFLAAAAEGSSVWFFSNVRAAPIYTVGDSITAGHGGPNSHCTSSDNCAFSQGENIEHTYQYWLDQYMRSSASAESVSLSYYNKGHGSQTCDQIRDRFASDITDGVDVILMCGINDFATGADHLEVQEDIQEIHTLASSKNDRLIVMEIIPDGNGLYCSDILAFNAWLAGFASSYEDVSMVHVHEALSSGTPCYYDPALYEADRVHPNEAGLEVLAQQIWVQIYGERVHGLEEQTTELYAGWDGFESTSAGSLFIGLREDLTGYPLYGTIDNMMIFSRALTEKEILDLYISQKPGGADCSDPDLDLDGFDRIICSGDDCDDADPEVNPGIAEVCDNEKDDDCDGLIDNADPDCPAPPWGAATHGEAFVGETGTERESMILNCMTVLLVTTGFVLSLRSLPKRAAPKK